MEWLKESWPYLVSWGGFVAASIVAIRGLYAAERDRQALRQAGLEREKLALEIARLRNSPEIVAERRAIYDRLRGVVSAITRDAAVSIDQIGTLHEIRHDAECRFSRDIVDSMRVLINAVVALHVAGEALRRGPNQMSADNWERQVARDHDALVKISQFESSMVDLFRPHLSV